MKLPDSTDSYAKANPHFLVASSGSRERKTWYVMLKPYNPLASELGSGWRVSGHNSISDC